MGQRRIHFAGRLRLTARRYLAMIGLEWGMHEDSAMTEVGSMAAGRAADRGSVSGYSADSARSSSSASSSSSRSDSPNSSSSRSDSGSFGEGSMVAARAADRASVAGYSGDSRQQGSRSSSRSDSGSFEKASWLRHAPPTALRLAPFALAAVMIFIALSKYFEWW